MVWFMTTSPSPPYTLRQLELFVAAVRAGTFAGAAEALFVTPTAVSVAVGELERELGLQLLTRRRALGVVPTPAGVHLMDRAVALLRDAADIHLELASGRGDLTGPVSLGCYTTLAATILPGLIAGFTHMHPGVSLTVVDGTMDELLEQQRRGALDLVIGYRINLPAGLEQVELYETAVHVLVAADHPLATAESVSLQDLVDEPLVMLDLPPSGRHTLDMLQAAGINPRIAHRSANFELVRSLVARGFGYSLLVQKPKIDTSWEGLPLVALPISPQFARESVLVMWPLATRLTDRAQALVEYARHAVGEIHQAEGPVSPSY